jgi:predicted GNAT family N-acyltransferase
MLLLSSYKLLGGNKMKNKYKIEIADKQDKIRYIYPIRKEVFTVEQGLPIHGMVYNELDAISNHYLLLRGGKVGGCISLVDLTGQSDLLKETPFSGYEGDVAKITKLAILRDYRGSYSALKKLLDPVVKEIGNYRNVFADLGTENLPGTFVNKGSFLQEQIRKAQRYMKIGGLEKIRLEEDCNGMPHLVIGRASK